MKILEDDHCPDCGVELTKVRQGRFGTPCGMFHIYPGIAKLVISVVNNERDDIKSIITGKKPLITRETANSAMTNSSYSNAKIKKTLGFEFTDINVDLKSLLKEVGYTNWSKSLNHFPLIACDKFVPIIKLIGI